MNKKTIYYELVDAGFPMVQASDFGGKRICATKMGMSFADVKKAAYDGSCPDRFTKCDGNGKIAVDNQICIPDFLHKSEGCPITSMQFIESGSDEDQDFTYVDFADGLKLGFSKVSDSLPITDFQVQQNKPCLSSITGSWANDNYEQVHYLNEYSRL